ncbi:hypothetical protein EVC24_009 [Rhizobium phage RHph_I4]|nr:hypothetical protein EVC24_009 [Rhizobium phage RHph_I4]
MVRDVRLGEGRTNDSLATGKSPIPDGGLSPGEATHSVRGFFLRQVGKAFTADVRDVKVGNHKNVLLPLSQCHIKKLGGMQIEIYMKGWLYREKFN